MIIRQNGRRRHAVVAMIATMAVAGTACGGDDDNTLTLYSGRSETLIQPIIDEFEAMTDISVEVKYGDNADLALLIAEEAAAGRTVADVFLSQSPGAMGFVDEHLAEMPSDILALAVDGARDDDKRWVGLSARQRVLVYNSDLVDPSTLPDSIFELVTDDRWSDQIGVAGGNGSFQDFVTAMRFTDGEASTEQFLADLASLDPVAYSGNSAIVEAVGRGEVEVGLVNHYYNFRALEEDPNVASQNHTFADGDAGASLIVTTAALVDGSDQAGPAGALLTFLLSDAGQRYFADETYEYPVAPGVATAGGVPEIELADVGGIDLNELEGGLERTRELIADAGLES